MHSLLVNLFYFFYKYGWTILEVLLLAGLIWTVIKVKKVSFYFIYLSLFLFLASAFFVIFNSDYIAGKLGEIISLLLAVSSIALFIKERKK